MDDPVGPYPFPVLGPPQLFFPGRFIRFVPVGLPPHIPVPLIAVNIQRQRRRRSSAVAVQLEDQLFFAVHGPVFRKVTAEADPVLFPVGVEKAGVRAVIIPLPLQFGTVIIFHAVPLVLDTHLDRILPRTYRRSDDLRLYPIFQLMVRPPGHIPDAAVQLAGFKAVFQNDLCIYAGKREEKDQKDHPRYPSSSRP